ncbi:MAG: hypothetical protein DRR11_15665, partial [Gammaproteobacteria bacterium]
SFRSHLAMGTLAVRLIIPPVGLIEDFHLQVSAPCRAHHKKNGPMARFLISARCINRCTGQSYVD